MAEEMKLLGVLLVEIILGILVFFTSFMSTLYFLETFL